MPVFRQVNPDNVTGPFAERAKDTTACSRVYLGEVAGREVVLLIVDLFDNEFRIHEIMVLATDRGQGFGSAALAKAEEIARLDGRNEMTGVPKPLDATTKRGDLIAWYERHGFVRHAFQEGELWKKQL